MEIWEYLRLGSLEIKPEAEAYGPYILLGNKIPEKSEGERKMKQRSKKSKY